MKRRTYRRIRHRKPPSKSEGTFFKKESQETFFGGNEHGTFFKSPLSSGGDAVQRKCEKCEEDENAIQRQPEKKEEEKKVMRAEEKKEEEKVMKKEEKKEEEKVQREPEKKEDEKLQKKEATTSASSQPVSNYIGSLSGKGESLSPSTNEFFSTRMGYDFSDVRVHKDQKAAESAKAINAKAYVVGNNIVFNEGQFDTHSSEGKKLMAHELAHVMQQGSEETLSRKKTIAQDKGMDVDTEVSSRMPSIIDAILAASNVLKPYIDVKNNLIAEKGKFKISIGYENLKKEYKDCHDGNEPDVTIGGFFCRKTGVIHAVAGNNKEPTSVFGDVIHEAIHKKSSRMLASVFTDFVNEGVTQYFADKVLVEQELGQYKKHKYQAQLKCAEDLVRVAGEDVVAEYYFKGKGSLIDVLNTKFSKELTAHKSSHIAGFVRKSPSPGFFCTMLKNKR